MLGAGCCADGNRTRRRVSGWLLSLISPLTAPCSPPPDESLEFPVMTPDHKPSESSGLSGRQDPHSLTPPEPAGDHPPGDRPVADPEAAAAAERGPGTGPPPRLRDFGTWLLILNGLLLAGFPFWLWFRGGDEARIRLIADLDFIFFGLCQVGMA